MNQRVPLKRGTPAFPVVSSDPQYSPRVFFASPESPDFSTLFTYYLHIPQYLIHS